ncbi:MAG: glycosyltransferase [Coleofasciculus sp. B1-GNL1-01]|uniref:glycosyltransferase n=1 Tax=Coleofasciculus sp. B1-GNL1-01 TaxID=3068484 RepID=UPI0032F34674
MSEITDNSRNSNFFVILIPVFNDWNSLEVLLIHLEKVFENETIKAEIIAVDDASNIAIHENFISFKLTAIKKISILELRRNVGHQRAIAIGLAYIEENIACKAIIIMDGDGEDSPLDVIRLIKKCETEQYRKVVFARRSKRSEGFIFKLFYVIYKNLYKFLTGQEIRVGNFSIIPRKILCRLVAVSEIWNHYAAGVLKAKVPCTDIYSQRGKRLSGKSQMNFVQLVIHGLSAISVYADIVGIRLLFISCLLIVMSLIFILVVVGIKLLTELAIPGWTSYIVALLFIVFMQGFMLSMIFVFVVLTGRNNLGCIPKRDYRYFVLEAKEL